MKHLTAVPALGAEVGRLRYGNASVVADYFSVFLALLRFDQPDDTAGHDTTREQGAIRQHKRIQGISIAALRHETEVERKHHPSGRLFFNTKPFSAGVEGIFVP
jgi:hypothetical protein